MATYAIGDIQACYEELQQLLALIQFSSADKLWFVGDLLNRGPQSLAVMKLIYSIQDSCTIVLGNHDLHFLAVAKNCVAANPKDTLDELLKDQDCELYCAWLRQQKLCHYDADLNYLMVHAGFAPQWPRQQALQLAEEVSLILQSDDYVSFLQNMYGDTPDCWRDDLQSWDRLRLITNYLTRLRFCTAEGRLDLQCKAGVGSQPEGYYPWFSAPGRQTATDKIVFGHWAALAGQADAENVYALDTGCIWGGKLTAMRLEDQAIFAVDSLQK